MPYILDIIVLILILLCVIRGIRRGAVRTAFSLFSFIIALILTFMFASPFAQFIEKQPWGMEMHQSIEGSLTDKIDAILEKEESETTNTTESILNTLLVPEFMKNSLLLKSDFVVRNADVPASEAVADALASAYVKAISSVVLFILLLLLLRILRIICEQLFKLPLLKDVNRIVGAAAGLVNGIFIAYLLLSAISALSGMPTFEWLASAMESSYIFKNVYENNAILSAIL
ncbi:MAG: CvpA family protein [Clostridia bacterium]|nr:CvpA family protein [Clostridia bacterium]